MATKFKIIVSDLHLGAGLDGAGGNRLEDFISDVEFVEWVHALTDESNASGADVEFIINGDLLEMLQTPAVPRFNPVTAYSPELYAANDEASAKQKLTHIVQGHPGVFAALADFIQPANPRRNVVILRGNHDPELYWPGVQQAIREQLGATGELENLLEFPPVHYFRDGVYVEHGNQYTENVNRFTNPAAPIDAANPSNLELIWGSRFVVEYFNYVEREREWVDGVTPIVGLIWYSLQHDFAFAVRALQLLLEAAPRMLFTRDTEQSQQEETNKLLAELNDSSNLPALQAQYESNLEFRRAFQERVLSALRSTQGDETFLPTRGTASEDVVLVASQIVEHYREELYAAAERIATETGARLVSFGHTHAATTARLLTGAKYINSGCWVSYIDLTKATPTDWENLFRQPQVHATRRQLNFVRVDYDAKGELTAQLLEVGKTAPSPDKNFPDSNTSNASPQKNTNKGCLFGILMLPFK